MLILYKDNLSQSSFCFGNFYFLPHKFSNNNLADCSTFIQQMFVEHLCDVLGTVLDAWDITVN